jgi:hypothetical protein
MVDQVHADRRQLGEFIDWADQEIARRLRANILLASARR